MNDLFKKTFFIIVSNLFKNFLPYETLLGKKKNLMIFSKRLHNFFIFISNLDIYFYY